MPNASLTGEWEGSPAIVYVVPVSAESSMLRIVSTTSSPAPRSAP